MNSKPHRAIIVLGMHRSGTSTITRGLQVLGARLGNRLLDPRNDNPKGFWEDRDLTDLNQDMFESVGMAWDRLTPMTREELSTLVKRGFLEKASKLLEEKLDRDGIVALKHPRTAKIFPFWKEVFAGCGYEVDYLLAVRHPLSVAKSLEHRDRIRKCYGVLMWLGYVIPSLSVPKGSRALVTDYDRFMSDPTSELQRIADCFHMEVVPDELKSFRDEFLDDNLRHSTFTQADLEADNELPPLVMEVYRGLMELASDRACLQDAAFASRIEKWTREFEDSFSYLRFIETITAEHAHQAVLLNTATNDLRWRDASLSWRMTKPLRSANTLVRRFLGR